jgi:hypothetical protein
MDRVDFSYYVTEVVLSNIDSDGKGKITSVDFRKNVIILEKENGKKLFIKIVVGEEL